MQVIQGQISRRSEMRDDQFCYGHVNNKKSRQYCVNNKIEHAFISLKSSFPCSFPALGV
jgi:hypothetical protein